MDGFEGRCHRAVSVVARDARRTWGALDLAVAVHDAEWDQPPGAYVTVQGRNQPDQDNVLHPEMSDDELVVVAAHAVRETLLTQFALRWPRCAAHGRDTHLSWMDADPDSEQPTWRCAAGGDGHAVAVIGELPREAVMPPTASADDLRPA